MTTPSKNAQTAALEALIEAHAIELKLPTVRRRFKALAAEALARRVRECLVVTGDRGADRSEGRVTRSHSGAASQPARAGEPSLGT